MRFVVLLLGVYLFKFNDQGEGRINWWATIRSCTIVFGSSIFTIIVTYVNQTRTKVAGNIIYHFRRECFAFLMLLSHCTTFCYFKKMEKLEKILARLEKGLKKKGSDKDHWPFVGPFVVANILQQVATSSAYGNLKVASNIAMNLILYSYAISFEKVLRRIARCCRHCQRQLRLNQSYRVAKQRVLLVEASRTAMTVYAFKVLSTLWVCCVFIVANLDYIVAVRNNMIMVLVTPALYTASYGYLIVFIIVKPCVDVIHADNQFRELLLVNYLKGMKSMPLGLMRRTLSNYERIKFEPWGLFELNFKLITSILSLTTSYLFIILQIQN